MSVMQPVLFSEIARLHRAVLSDAKGSLVLTCAQDGEGASFISYLMALRNAGEGRKTLLIDFNIKNNWLTKELGLVSKEWVASDYKYDILGHIIPVVNNLDFVPAPANADATKWLSEILHIKNALAGLMEEYDHVIIDTTPLTATNRNNIDAALLAAAANKTVLVMLAGVTPRRKIRQAMQDLQTSGANLVGVAVNNKSVTSPKNTLLAISRIISKVLPDLGNWLACRARDL